MDIPAIIRQAKTEIECSPPLSANYRVKRANNLSIRNRGLVFCGWDIQWLEHDEPPPIEATSSSAHVPPGKTEKRMDHPPARLRAEGPKKYTRKKELSWGTECFGGCVRTGATTVALVLSVSRLVLVSSVRVDRALLVVVSRCSVFYGFVFISLLYSVIFEYSSTCCRVKCSITYDSYRVVGCSLHKRFTHQHISYS